MALGTWFTDVESLSTHLKESKEKLTIRNYLIVDTIFRVPSAYMAFREYAAKNAALVDPIPKERIGFAFLEHQEKEDRLTNRKVAATVLENYAQYFEDHIITGDGIIINGDFGTRPSHVIRCYDFMGKPPYDMTGIKYEHFEINTALTLKEVPDWLPRDVKVLSFHKTGIESLSGIEKKVDSLTRLELHQNQYLLHGYLSVLRMNFVKNSLSDRDSFELILSYIHVADEELGKMNSCIPAEHEAVAWAGKMKGLTSVFCKQLSLPFEDRDFFKVQEDMIASGLEPLATM